MCQSRCRSGWFFKPADELHGALGEPLEGLVDEAGKKVMKVVSKGTSRQKVTEEQETGRLKSALRLGAMLRWTVRYFSDGAAIGSGAFVDGLFE